VRRHFLVAPILAAAWSLAIVAPAAAHGDHDARPLARQLAAGPYVVSLWQVYPDVGSAITPHLIVMFDGRGSVPASARVSVTQDTRAMDLRPSTTTANGLETTEGVAEGDVIAVTIADGTGTWPLAPVVVPPPPTSLLPMEQLLYVAIVLTGGTAWWVVGRTARAWRRPAALEPA